MKKCSVCEDYKDFSNFYNYKSSNDGKSYRCKECDNKARRKWARENPKRASESARGRTLKHKYGITLDDYKELFEKQGNLCKICKTDENKVTGDRFSKISFAVDHDHTTGEIRGILCNQCNRALGMFRDDPYIIKSAYDYLKEYYETH